MDLSIPRRKRCVRRNNPGEAHYLTCSCYQRRPFFTRDRPRHWLIDAIHRARVQHAFDLWAWVIMPEHVHLIVRPREKVYSISAILKAIKQPVGQRALDFLRQEDPAGLAHLAHRRPNGVIEYRFWQVGGGYDRNLYSMDEIWEKIRYIHNNPVCRKLVLRPEDWAWSSAADFAGKRQESERPLQVDSGSIPRW